MMEQWNFSCTVLPKALSSAATKASPDRASTTCSAQKRTPPALGPEPHPLASVKLTHLGVGGHFQQTKTGSNSRF